MLTDNFVTMEIGKAKHIALVAHDGKKKELINGAIEIKKYYRDISSAEQEQQPV